MPIYIPQVDYSPMYNAVQARGSAKQSQYAAQSVTLQKKGFALQQRSIDASRTYGIISGVTSMVETLANVGMKIYGMYEADQMEKAKTDILGAQPKIEQQRVDMITRGEYGPVDTESGPSIQLDASFDGFVQQQIQDVSSKYADMPSVQNYVESSLLQYANSEKSAALQSIAQKTIADLNASSIQNMESAVDQSILQWDPAKDPSEMTAENVPLIKAQLDSEYWRTPEEKKIRLTNALEKAKTGVIKKNIRTATNNGGVNLANQYIDSLDMIDDKKDQYRAYAATSFTADSQNWMTQIQEVATNMEKEGKSPGQIGAAIAGKSNIPAYYRQEAAKAFYFKEDLETTKDIVDSLGVDAGRAFVNSPEQKFSDAQKDQALAAVDTEFKKHATDTFQQWTTLTDKAIEQGENPATLYDVLDQTVETKQMAIDYKSYASNAIAAKQTANLDQTFNDQYEDIMFDLKGLREYRDVIQTDAGNSYKNVADVQVKHLEKLDRQIAALTPTDTKDSKAEAFNQWANAAWLGYKNGTYPLNELFREMSTPGTYANKVMIEGGSGVRTFIDKIYEASSKSNPLSDYARAKTADFETILDNTRSFDDTRKNEVLAGYTRAMLNEIETNQNVSTTDLDDIDADYRFLTVGKGFDALSAHVTARGGVNAGKSDKQVFEIQKMIDTNDLEVTTNITGDVALPSIVKSDYEYFRQAQRRMLSEILGTSEQWISYQSGEWSGDYQNMLEGFSVGKGDRANLQPVYVYNTPNGEEWLYTIRAGEKNGEYHIYQIIKDANGKNALSEVMINQPEDLEPMKSPAVDQTTLDNILKNIPGQPTAQQEATSGMTEIEKRQQELKKKYPGLF